MNKIQVIGYLFSNLFWVLLQLSTISVNSEPHYPVDGIWNFGQIPVGGRPPLSILQQPQLQQQPFVAASTPNLPGPIRIIGYQPHDFLGPQRLPQDLPGLSQFPIGVPIKIPSGSPLGMPGYPSAPLNPVYIIMGPFLLPIKPQVSIGSIPTAPVVEEDKIEMEGQTMTEVEPEKEMVDKDTGSPTDTRINYPKSSSDQCSHFSDGGSCYSLSECKERKGSPTGYCRDVSRFCCIFRESCGGVIQEQAAHFRNPDWPLTKTINTGSCGITIRKLNSDICSVRILPKKLELPANIGYCEDLSMDVEVGGKSYEKLCGSLTKSSYDIDVSKVDSISLKISSKVRTRLSWHIYITQIPCSDAQKKAWPQAGEKPKPAEPQPSKPKPTKVVEQEKPSAAVKSCGTSYTQKRSEANVSDRRQTPLLRDEEEQEDECVDCRSNFPNPLLQTLDWDVPTVHESDLFKHAGTPLAVGTRVTYGQQTKFHEYPWAVAMYNNGRFHCGGSLISDKHVLTAAHCVIKYRRRPSRLRLNLGDWNINSNSDGKAVIGRIQKIVTHPGYSTATLKYDVAVLTLSERVKFTDTLLPVCLPGSHERNLDGKLITVAGWGRDEKNRLQSVLMKHSAKVLSNRVCNQRWRQKGAPEGIIADTMLCMDPQDGDSCKGDSGGPACIEDPVGSGRFKQVGIVSFGSATCTDKRLPGVYTNVASVIGWIKAQMV